MIAEVRGRTQGGEMNSKIKEADKWRKGCERQNSGRRDEQQNQGGGNGGIQNGYLRGDQEDSIRYGFFFGEGFQ